MRGRRGSDREIQMRLLAKIRNVFFRVGFNQRIDSEVIRIVGKTGDALR